MSCALDSERKAARQTQNYALDSAMASDLRSRVVAPTMDCDHRMELQILEEPKTRESVLLLESPVSPLRSNQVDLTRSRSRYRKQPGGQRRHSNPGLLRSPGWSETRNSRRGFRAPSPRLRPVSPETDRPFGLALLQGRPVGASRRECTRRMNSAAIVQDFSKSCR